MIASLNVEFVRSLPDSFFEAKHLDLRFLSSGKCRHLIISGDLGITDLRDWQVGRERLCGEGR